MQGRLLLVILASVSLMAGLLGGGTEGTQAQGQGNGQPAAGPPPLPAVVPVCPPGPPERARCHSQRRTDVQGRPGPRTPVGYGPTELGSAYKLPALPAASTPWTWNGQTVAIVDAFH